MPGASSEYACADNGLAVTVAALAPALALAAVGAAVGWGSRREAASGRECGGETRAAR